MDAVRARSGLRRARTWVNRSLFNSPSAGDYFEYLVEGLSPAWSLTECRARVVGVVLETHDTRTWILKPSRRFAGFVAGQHLDLTVYMDGARETRTFSIASSPEQWRRSGTVAITVKRVPDGRVTGWMHDHLGVGDVVTLSAARGDFVPDGRVGHGVGYVAAGSGITPIMSQLRELTATCVPHRVTLLYFANGPGDFIFEDELRSIRDRFEAVTLRLITSRIEPAHVRALLSRAPEHVFLCGPPGFRDVARGLLDDASFDCRRVVEESFGPPRVKAAAGVPVTVSFRRTRTSATTDTPGTLLQLAERAGLRPRHGCRMGICHTCKCTKLSGRVENLLTGERSSCGREDVQICVSVPVTDVELEL